MKAALVIDGKVKNIIVVPSLDFTPNIVDGSGARIGDLWDGFSFSPDPNGILLREAEDQKQQALEEAKQGTRNDALYNVLMNASMAEIESNINGRTTIASLKPVLKALAKALAYTMRRTL